MRKILSCEFNLDTACVELRMDDGTLLSIDCTAVENEVANSMYQLSLIHISHNTALKKRLTQYAAAYPNLCRQTDDDEQGGLCLLYTSYPDVIESGLGSAAVIKSHHNVGGLPDYVDFKEIIEPLRLLFKDEVRQLGRELGLPEYLVSRQPFPGPGLAIRIMGEITKEKADTLRLADAIYREELEKVGENKKMNQYFAVLTDTRTVGVMGDGRSYDRVLALRAVTTEDFMTADWARIPYELLDKISGRIVNEVKGINRIVYDITSKPPATVEWE